MTMFKNARSCYLSIQPIQEIIAMDKDRIAGSTKKLKGSIKETIGKVTGDAKLQAEGKSDKINGEIQNAVGGAKDAVRDALEE